MGGDPDQRDSKQRVPGLGGAELAHTVAVSARRPREDRPLLVGAPSAVALTSPDSPEVYTLVSENGQWRRQE